MTRAKSYAMESCFSAIFALVFPLILGAQNGPGGVGGSGTIPFWLDASTLSLGNGQSVSSWTDQSGNGNDAEQSTSNYQPTFRTNQINSNPTIDFDGGDYLKLLLISELDNQSDLTWMSVSSTNTAASYQSIISTDYTGGSAFGYKWASIFFQNKHEIRAKSDAGTTSKRNTSNSGGFTIRSTTMAGSSTDALLCYANGSQYGSVTPASFSTNTHKRTIIGRNSINGGGLLNGDIAELMVFSQVLNTTERIIIENYLSSKYGISITNDKYSFQGTNPSEVAGIGQESSTDNHTTAKGAGVVTITGADDLDDGEYLIWGHDAGAFASQSTEIPVALSGGVRLTREWVADETGGDLGTVDITFDMSQLSLGANPAEYRIITDTDGNFSNGNANPSITPVIVGTDVTFNNVDLSSETYFTIAHTSDVVECISFSSADWDDGTPAIVWDCGVTPDSTTTVTIDNGTIITIDADASCYDLLIEGGGTLLLSPGVEFVVKGDFTVNSGTPDGVVFFGSGSRIIFRGNEGSPQTFDNNTATALDIAELQVSNSDGLTLASGGSFGISEGLFLTGGSITNSGTLTLTSDATSTGHIAKVNGLNTITGSIEVERFRSARAADWSTIGNSGVTTDLEDLDDDIFMSGIPGSDGTAAGFISIAYYDNSSDAYVVPGNTSDNFAHGRGYEVWLGDNLTTWAAQAWTLDGSINTAVANLSVNAGGGGWNLLANPYPAFLDFSVINTANVQIQGNEWWYYDADIASYNSNGTSVDIPPGQGFWIDWATGTSTIDLDITADIVDLSSSTYYKADEKEELRIGIRRDSSVFGSAVFLRKDEMAFAGVDENDLTPLRLPDPRSCHLVMEYAGEDMMLNYVSDYEDHIEIPMRFEAGLPGEYTMSFKGLDHFEDYQCINIIDEDDGTQIELISTTTLKVTIGENVSERRFKLLLSKADYADCLAPEDLSDEDIRITSIGKTIMTDFFLDRSVSADITIYNVLGAPVFSTNKPVGYSRETFDLNHLQSGLYVVNVSINGSITTEKVILQ
jgi:hypothetical protein